MNPDLGKLQRYPFEKLAALKHDCTPPADVAHIALSIGEPKHAAPDFVAKRLAQHSDGLGRYPNTRGLDALRQAIKEWLLQRFDLGATELSHERHILPLNGTREGLFAIAQCLVDNNTKPRVLMPNPFYQIYEGAALLAGAEPYYMNCVQENGFLPELDAVPTAVWQACQLVYICSPGNPTGAVMDGDYLQRLITLADTWDFSIVADECYAEVYTSDTAPIGLLRACAALGRNDFKHCLVMHSLSKRSNLPGLRSGFVVGDAQLIDAFFRYRTYHGCAMPLQTQYASIAAWQDEQHVVHNRALYKEKFDAVLEILAPVIDVQAPDASFYLWPRTPIDEVEFARKLFIQKNVTVLPGSFLSRETGGIDPGKNRVRIALVAELEECLESARRIKKFVENL
ncbi:MAG: succinyldiaminopimelate transaminase [Pseudomonadales bacterium]